MLEWIANIIFGGIIGEIFAAILTAVVSIFVGIVNTIIGAIAWVIFQIATWFIDIAIQMNTQVATSAVIQNGFEKVLMFANLGIIVALVVIAFMVMLRKGDAAKLLTRFIIMALLINFGFFITTTLFVKPVDEITLALDRATNFGPITFATAFIPPLQITTIAEPPGGPNPLRINEESILPGLTFDVIVSLTSVLFSVAFLAVGTITLFGFAGLLFIRYIYLGILIILLPIAWLSYVFPDIKIAGGHPFTQWWGQFIRWLLFAPISMFFFFLAVQSVDINALDPIRIEESRHYFSSSMSGIAASIADMVIIIGLMVGGMIVANNMGIKGASAVLSTAKKVGTYAKKRSGRELVRMASAPIRNKKVKKQLENLQKANIPLVGRPVKLAGRGVMAATAKSEQYIMEEEMKRFKNLPPYMVAQQYHGLPNDLQKLAALAHMQKEGYAWESSIAKDLGRMKKKGLIEKYGLQKFDIGAAGEGIVSDVFAAKFGAKEKGRDIDKEELAAILKKTLDKLSSSDIGKFSPYLFADYNSDKPQFGFETEQEFNDYRELVTNYLVEYRPESINGLRSRQTGSGQAYVNRTLESFASEGGTFEDQVFAHLGDAKKRAREYIDSADPKKKTVKFSEATDRDKERHIQTHWEKGVKVSILKVYDARIDARTDLDTDGTDKEKERVRAELESIGPEGFIARHVHQGRARKGGFMFTPFSTTTTSPSEETT